MAVRIQIRRDTASNWVTNNPMLYPGEIGLETDTLQFKVGPAVESPAVGTAWNSIAEYANVVPGDLNSTLDGYLEVTDIGAVGGVVGLNNSKNAIIPGSSIIIEGSTNDAYETTLTVTDPTADRTLTLPDTDGTIATESYVDTAISEFDALPTQTGNNGKFLQTDGSTTTWATVDLSTKQDKVTGVSDTEIGYLDGVTSSIQTQLGNKQDKVSNVSDTEIGYLDGVTSAIQTQLNSKFASADASTTNITEGTRLYFTDDRAQDAVATAIANGTHTNISISYDDENNAISFTGAQTYSNENARDAVAAMITDSTHSGISVSYTDDGSSEGTLAFTNTGVTSLSGTANEVTVSSSNGEVTIGLPDNVTIGNNLVVSGDLDVQGTTKTTFTTTVLTHDNLIYLNAAFDTTITNAVGDGTYVTYTADNNYDPGMDIRVTGMDPADYNISSADGLTIYSANATQFVVAKTATGTFVSGGTAHAKTEANADLGFSGGYYDAGYAHAGLFRDATDGKFKIFDGYTPEPDEEVNIDTTHVSFALADFVAGSIEVTSATIGDVSNTEISYLNGVTSSIQDQLDNKSTASKVETFTNKTLTSPNINEEVALTATATELNYVVGVTSAIQDQLDDKASLTGTETLTNKTLENPTVNVVTTTTVPANDSFQFIASSLTYPYTGDDNKIYMFGTSTATPISYDGNQINLTNVPATISSPAGLSSYTFTAFEIIIDSLESYIGLTLNNPTTESTAALASWASTSSNENISVTYQSGTESQEVTTVISSSELVNLNNVSSNIQAQLDGKQAVISGVSSTEIGYLDGVTSSIQDQLDSKEDSLPALSSPPVSEDLSIALNVPLDVTYDIINDPYFIFITPYGTIDDAAIAEFNIDIPSGTNFTLSFTNSMNNPPASYLTTFTKTGAAENVMGMQIKIPVEYVSGDTILYSFGNDVTIEYGESNAGKYLTNNGTSLSWGIVDALPSQTGEEGKYLTTDGTDASWETIEALPSQLGNNGKYLTTDGTDASWAEGLNFLPSVKATTVRDTINNPYGVINNDPATIDLTTQDLSLDGNIVLPYDLSDGDRILFRDADVLEPEWAGIYTFDGAVGALVKTSDVITEKTVVLVDNSYGFYAGAYLLGSTINTKFEWSPLTLPTNQYPGTGTDAKFLSSDGANLTWINVVSPISTGTATITGNTAASVDSFSLFGQSIEYTVSLSQGSKRRTSKVLVSCTGSAVDMTEFAIIEMGGVMSGIQITATESASSGNLEIVVTDAASTNVDVRFTKIEI